MFFFLLGISHNIIIKHSHLESPCSSLPLFYTKKMIKTIKAIFKADLDYSRNQIKLCNMLINIFLIGGQLISTKMDQCFPVSYRLFGNKRYTRFCLFRNLFPDLKPVAKLYYIYIYDIKWPHQCRKFLELIFACDFKFNNN